MIATTAPSGSATGVNVNARQSIRLAWPATAPAEINWSMIPVGTPTTSCSTRCPSRAIATGSQRRPVMASTPLVTATSIAADDERLAPIGMSLSIVARHPPDAIPSAASRATVPAT